MNLTEEERSYIEGVINITYQRDYHKEKSYTFNYSVPPLESAVQISRKNPEDQNVIRFGPVNLFLKRINKLKKDK